MKIGLLGTGYLGKIHLKCIRGAEGLDLIGFFDPNDEAANEVIETFGIQRYESPEALMNDCEAVDIVTPTSTHFALAKQALNAGKHVFIEKPVTETPEQAAELMQLSREKGLTIQVGHVERFNPAMLSVGDMDLNPMFIEGHRLAPFNPRSTDVSVVLDLMIHDLDIVLSMVDSEVVDVQANGVTIISDTADIANARITFANGCVANLTASRMSLKQMRKIRFFQKDAYISLDFLEKESQVIRLYDDNVPPSVDKTQLLELPTPKGKRHIQITMPPIQAVNAIQMELETFAKSVKEGSKPMVSIEDGYKALKLAHQINEFIAN